MPTIPVDNKGTVLYYEDSGAPAGSSSYLTVVLVHGILFHGEIFKQLVPYGPTKNLRIIRVNQRDYPGSTPYSAEELETLAGDDIDRRAAFLQEIGHQFAMLIVNLARELRLPPITTTDGKTSGGVTLVAWSMGNSLSLAMLSNAGSLPAEVQDAMSKCLHTLVMLDPVAGTTTGSTPSQGTYHPFRDTTLSIEQRMNHAQIWLSYYFTKVPDLDHVIAEFLESRVAQHELPGHEHNSNYIPTVLRIPPGELESMKDTAALARSSLPLLRSNAANFRRNFEKALFDTDGVLPSVKVVVAWCDETMGDAVLAAKIIHDRIHTDQPEGKVGRSITMHRLEGTNHFPHWDCPEKVIEMLIAAP